MSPPIQTLSLPGTIGTFTAGQREVLSLLREAWDAARDEDCDVWQFAVEIDQLRDIGLSCTDLRRLLCWGLLTHAQERTTGNASQRLFQPLQALAMPGRTCFVLTPKGMALASAGVQKTLSARFAPEWESTPLDTRRKDIPYWDGDLRQLWWQDYLIKQFRVHADNQERVLDALEEEGWPSRIDDPLPRVYGIDPKDRLHDTLKALNRHHRHRLVHFRGDGKGLGICWILHTTSGEDAR